MLAMALTEATRAMTSVQIPVYLRWLGADVTQVGLFFTISAVVPLILLVLGGWLSDSIGRLPAFAIGSLAGALGFAAFALAPSWSLALIGPAFLAVALALIRPAYRAYVADRTRPETRGRVFALAETAANVTWIFGPPLGGFLAQRLGFTWLFFVTALAYLLAGGVILQLARASRRRSEPKGERPTLQSLRTSVIQMGTIILSGGLVTWLLITDGIRDIAFRLSFDLMPVYLNDVWGLSRQRIGLLDGIFGAALVAAGYPAGWLCDKASERVALVGGLVAVIASRLAFIMVNGFWGFAFSWSLLAVGVALMDPAIQSLVSKGVPPRLRGIAYGLLATSWGILSLPSPWIGGLLWDRYGPRAPFIATVAIGVLALAPAWARLKAPAPPAMPETQPGS
jgi:MFS family permease